MRFVTLIAQFALYAGFMAALVVFSSAPAYQHLGPGSALVKMSFDHATAKREPCRRRTQAELDAIAPNMRRPEVCSRERIDLFVAITIDGDPAYTANVAPSGLARDGEATVYEKFVVDAGTHVIEVSMRDSARESGFDYSARHTATLAPGQLLVIDFDRVGGGFSFR